MNCNMIFFTSIAKLGLFEAARHVFAGVKPIPCYFHQPAPPPTKPTPGKILLTRIPPKYEFTNESPILMLMTIHMFKRGKSRTFHIAQTIAALWTEKTILRLFQNVARVREQVKYALNV